MSQTPNQIGSAKVVFEGDTKPLEQAAARAIATTKQAAETAEQAAKKVVEPSQEVVSAQEKVAETTEKVAEASEDAERSGLKHGRQMLGMVGTAAALLGSFEKLLKGIDSVKNASAELADGFDRINSAAGGSTGSSATGAQAAINSINQALDEQRKTIGKAMDDWSSLGAVFEKLYDLSPLGKGKIRAAQEEQLKQIESTRERLTEAAEKKARDDQEELDQQTRIREEGERKSRTWESLRSIQEDIASTADGELTEQQRINKTLEERKRTIAIIRDDAASNGQLTPALERELNRLDSAAEQFAKKFSERLARSMREAIEQELDRVKDSARGLFKTGDMAVEISQIRELMNTLVNDRNNWRPHDVDYLQ